MKQIRFFLITIFSTLQVWYVLMYMYFQVHMANKQPALAAALSLELGNILKVSEHSRSRSRMFLAK